MPRYRKKPVEVNAYQMTNNNMYDWWNWPAWLHEALFKVPGSKGSLIKDGCTIHIHTLDGKQLVSTNDYIIQDVKGEIYPCKPDIFEMKYEEVIE